MDNERLLYLLQRCIKEKTTAEEERELFFHLAFCECDETLTNFAKEIWEGLPLGIRYHTEPGIDPGWGRLSTTIQDP